MKIRTILTDFRLVFLQNTVFESGRRRLSVTRIYLFLGFTCLEAFLYIHHHTPGTFFHYRRHLTVGCSVMKLSIKEQRLLKSLVLPLLDDLHRLAYHLCHNANDAEDLVSETVRKACENFRSLRNPDKIKPWLFRILRNTFVSICRERNQYKSIGYDESGNNTDDEQFSLFTEVSQPFLLWWGNPERELVNKLLEEDIERALAEIPPDFRFVVVLCDVEGLSYDEISKTLNIPIGTVRSRIARGRSILQKKLYTHAVERGIIRKKERRHAHIRT
jgi:RNA polymerase sigma-70 factor, ECF subfamily